MSFPHSPPNIVSNTETELVVLFKNWILNTHKCFLEYTVKVTKKEKKIQEDGKNKPVTNEILETSGTYRESTMLTMIWMLWLFLLSNNIFAAHY